MRKKELTKAPLCNECGVRPKIERKDGYHRPTCRECWRSIKTASRYGITVEEVLLLQKKERCAICGKHKSTERYGKLHIDHCHNSGKVRDMLCTPCNTSIGLLGEDINTVLSVLEYLKKHESETES